MKKKSMRQKSGCRGRGRGKRDGDTLAFTSTNTTTNHDFNHPGVAVAPQQESLFKRHAQVTDLREGTNAGFIAVRVKEQCSHSSTATTLLCCESSYRWDCGVNTQHKAPTRDCDKTIIVTRTFLYFLRSQFRLCRSVLCVTTWRISQAESVMQDSEAATGFVRGREHTLLLQVNHKVDFGLTNVTALK